MGSALSSSRDRVTARNNVRIWGHGEQTLVFLHGFGCDQSMWRFVTPSFEQNYRILLFDLTGSGRSDLSAFDLQRHSQLEGYAEDVVEILLALNLTEVIFVGHSVSAMIGAIAALSHPELFSHLLFVAPSPCYINHPPDYVGGFDQADIEEMLELMDRNYMGWASFLAPVVASGSNNPELAEELETSFCSTDPVTAKTFAKATFFSDHRAILPQVSTPCLILQCSEDAVAPVEVGQYLQAHLPNSHLVQLAAVGHCPHVSHAAETIEAIQNYLATT